MPKRKLNYSDIKSQIDKILAEHGPREKLRSERNLFTSISKKKRGNASSISSELRQKYGAYQKLTRLERLAKTFKEHDTLSEVATLSTSQPSTLFSPAGKSPLSISSQTETSPPSVIDLSVDTTKDQHNITPKRLNRCEGSCCEFTGFHFNENEKATTTSQLDASEANNNVSRDENTTTFTEQEDDTVEVEKVVQHEVVVEDVDEDESEDEDEPEDEDEIEEDTTGNDIFCDNCHRHTNIIQDLPDIYDIEFIRRSSAEIKRRRKFKNVVRNSVNIRYHHFCVECDTYLCRDIPQGTNTSTFLWPAFVWEVLKNANVRNMYNNYAWRFLPLEWRGFWLNSLGEFNEFSDVSLKSPPSFFADKTEAVRDWKELIGRNELRPLMDACNKYMMPVVLCPYGCSEHIFHSGIMTLDCVWQRFLSRCIIDLISDPTNMKYASTVRDDFIREKNDYDVWLYNPKWKVRPSIIFTEDGPMVMTCRNHNGGTDKLFIHIPRQPKHILPSFHPDQLAHVSIKPRTISPMKAKQYSSSFQMHEQRGTFNGIDTCSITSYHNFAINSILLRECMLRSVENRADINALLNTLVKDGVIPKQFVSVIREAARAECCDIDFDYYISGATYVPVSAALWLQEQKNQKPIKVIWDVISRENPFEVTQYCKKSFVSVLFPVQKCNKYGVPFPPLNSLSRSPTVSTLGLWVISAMLSRVELLWQNVSKVSLRQSQWHGWILMWLTKKLFNHVKCRPEKTDPFKYQFINNIERISNKCRNCYSNGSFRDAFAEVGGTLFFEDPEELEHLFEEEEHNVLIRECDEINFDQVEMNFTTDNDIEFELCCGISYYEIDELNYSSEVFSRHGGQHCNWFYQHRNDHYCREWVDNPSFREDGKRIFIYCRKLSQKMEDVNRELMKYIGGQTHIVCDVHKIPLITMFNRVKKCECGKSEHFACADPKCRTCICKRCANQLDSNIINKISPPTMDLDAGFVTDDESSDEESEQSDQSDDDSVPSIDVNDMDDYMITGGGMIDGEDEISHDESEASEGDDDEENFFIPTTDAGEMAFQVESDSDNPSKRGTNTSMHVLLNLCASLLTRKKHKLSPSSLQRFFVERVVSTNFGTSVPLLYPEGMLFPSVFYSMKNGSIIGAMPSSVMSDLMCEYGFSPINDHLRSRLTSPSNQTSTNPRYISYCYDVMTNSAVTHSDTRIALNRGLHYNDSELDGLSVRGKNDSPLLESIDSNQMVRNLTAAQKYYMMDYFVTFTCNQKKHFGTKPIKTWIDGDEWKQYYPGYFDLTSRERKEIKDQLLQASAGLLLRAWNETCRYFLEFLRTSSSSPFKNVLCMFARHEYQKDVGNLPHIHAMIKIDPDTFSENENYFMNEMIRASILEVVRPADLDDLKRKDLIFDVADMKDAIKDAEITLPHKCNDRCLRYIGNGEYVCRAVQNLMKNKPPNNVRSYLEPLPNGLSPECLQVLQEIKMIDPLVVHENGYVEPFKAKNTFFHPHRCIAAVNWNDHSNISPVISELFVACRGMQNIQQIFRCGGCNKYCVKYMSKIDEQNYVIVSVDGRENGVLVTRTEHLHNTKITSSKINEDQKREERRDSKMTHGRAISLCEMLHHMLKYSEVQTDLSFVNLPTTSLEIRPGVALKRPNEPIDGAAAHAPVDTIRRMKGLPPWRQLTESEILVSQDRILRREKIDAITQFSLRPPELRKIFDKVGDYFRWFKIEEKINKKEKINDMITDNLSSTCWIDTIGCKVLLRKKAISEVCKYLDELSFPDQDSPEHQTIQLFYNIRDFIEQGNNCGLSDEMKNHLSSNIILNDDHLDHLPIPVYSFIQPTMGIQFVLHLMLSMGRFSTELDLTLFPTIRESLRYSKLIGPNDDEESLKEYVNKLLYDFIEEQLVYFPNSRQIIDSWIVIAHELLINIVLHDEIPIVDIPPVQMTSLYAMKSDEAVAYREEIRRDVVSSALTELSHSSEDCDLPSRDALLNVTKHDPLDWDASECFHQSEGQPHASFLEQKLAIDTCKEAIDRYCDPTNINFIKNITIRGFAGCGKSWLMQYMVIYAASQGLNCLTTAMMARRSNFLGGKHIHHMFCLPTDTGLTVHKMADYAVDKLNKPYNSTKLDFLRTLDVLFYDEIGQLSAEMLSLLDCILRRIRSSNAFFGGVLCISTMDHLQLQPVVGRPFLLSSHILTCFKMVQLKTSVRAANDIALRRILEICCMHPSKYADNPELLTEFRSLLEQTCTFVNNWQDPEITPETFRLYGMRVPAVEATKEFVENVRRTVPPETLRVKESIDMEKNRYTHCDWTAASPTTIATLDKKVKEPSVLPLYPGLVVEFTINSKDFTQSQIGFLLRVPPQSEVDKGCKLEVWIPRTGVREIVFNPEWTEEDLIRMEFKMVFAFIVPQRIIYSGRHVQCYRLQYCIKPRFTSTIHAAMGETLRRVALQINNLSRDFKLWDKAQVIVALSRTKYGKDIIFVGDKNDTINSIVDLIKKASQWSEYMEHVLELVTVNSSDPQRRVLTQRSYPFRIIDQALPVCNSGYVYFLISTRQEYVYIGRTTNIRRRLRQHNQGLRPSTRSTPINLRPYACAAFICGLDGNKALMCHIETKWQRKTHSLIDRGEMDWKTWARSGTDVINDLEEYNFAKDEVRLVLLFRD